jgi:two-component system, cell cycle sensor histidine kinase and response regulator CckA
LGSLAPCGTETILVVEDDDTVRDLIVRSLRAQGYTVQSAADGAEALHHARAFAPVWMDLLLTDVVMPGMSGPSLAAELATIYPDIRILYISGYSDHVNVRTVRSDSQAAFLAKPFSVTDLSWKVRELLDARVRPERQER